LFSLLNIYRDIIGQFLLCSAVMRSYRGVVSKRLKDMAREV